MIFKKVFVPCNDVDKSFHLSNYSFGIKLPHSYGKINGDCVQALLSAAVVAVAMSAPTAPVSPYGPPAPTYVPAPVPYPDEAPVYQYTYAVKDDYSFSNFNAHEERDGYNAAGGYQVALPDGRTQIVTYTATKVTISNTISSTHHWRFCCKKC